MPFKDKEKKKEYERQRYQKNKQKIINKQKEWNKSNPEKRKLICKKYYQKNKEKIDLYQQEYKKDNLGKRKTDTIYNWKRYGLICEDYDKLYNYYLSITECENCGIELNSGTGTRKCMDHCHDTGKFRNILCNTCNLSRY